MHHNFFPFYFMLVRIIIQHGDCHVMRTHAPDANIQINTVFGGFPKFGIYTQDWIGDRAEAKS